MTLRLLLLVQFPVLALKNGPEDKRRGNSADNCNAFDGTSHPVARRLIVRVYVASDDVAVEIC